MELDWQPQTELELWHQQLLPNIHSWDQTGIFSSHNSSLGSPISLSCFLFRCTFDDTWCSARSYLDPEMQFGHRTWCLFRDWTLSVPAVCLCLAAGPFSWQGLRTPKSHGPPSQNNARRHQHTSCRSEEHREYRGRTRVPASIAPATANACQLLLQKIKYQKWHLSTKPINHWSVHGHTNPPRRLIHGCCNFLNSMSEKLNKCSETRHTDRNIKFSKQNMKLK